jgi:hypothetical protein
MMASFSIIGMLLENARKAEARQTAERPKSRAEREKERRELRRDMAEGAASTGLAFFLVFRVL